MKKHNADQNVVVRTPLPLLAKFKDACNKNYKTVSEAVRDLMQRYIQENEDKK